VAAPRSEVPSDQRGASFGGSGSEPGTRQSRELICDLPAAGTCSTCWPRSLTRARKRGRRHALAGLLAVGAAAVTAGARPCAAIGQWAADAGPEVLAALGADRGPAEESTFRRPFALVSADVLGQVPGAWLWTRAVRAAAGSSSQSTARPSAARGARTGRPHPWSRPSPTAPARSSARSPWTRRATRSPPSGICSGR